MGVPNISAMSILLALLRSPRTPSSSRNRRENGTSSQYTEMGVFRRNNVGGLELQSYPSAPAASVSSHTDTASLGPTYSACSESEANQRSIEGPDITGSVGSSPLPVEVSFALNIVASGSSNTVNGLVKDTFERLCWSGYVLCKLLSSSVPGSLDERAINFSEEGADITPEDALENFQLCYSCAQAQGCDVQHYTVESLRDCEVAALTDFVLEVLRVCVVQEIPIGDRHWLIPPTQSPPSTSISRGPALSPSPTPYTANHHSQATSIPQQHHQQQSEPSQLHLRARLGRREACRSSSTNAVHDGQGQARGSEGGSSGTILQGSVAARRAVAGLEHWVLQLTKPEAEPTVAATGDSSSAAIENSEPVTQRERCGTVYDTAATAATSSLAVAATGSGRRSRESTQQDITKADGSLEATSTFTGTFEGDDALGLEVWERLVCLLAMRPSEAKVGEEEAVGAAARPAVSETTSDTGKQQAVAMAAEVAVAAAADTALEAAPVAAAGCRGRTEGERWAAAAAVLSQALARWAPLRMNSSGGSFSDGGSGGQGVTGTGKTSSLAPLGPEHLRCRHPGLRSLLLASALLASCRLRDAPAAAAAVATASLTTVRSGAICGGSDVISGGGGAESSRCSESSSINDLMATVTDTGATTSVGAAKPPPASPAPPAPPAPPLQQQHEQSGGRATAGRGGRGSLRSTGGGGHGARVGGRQDVLTEHNKLVQREHEQRALRRQMMMLSSAGSGGWDGGSSGGGGSESAGCLGTAAAAGGGGRVDEGAGYGALWSGDGEDVEGEDQEERVLRLWLNSLDARIHVGSLFAADVTTGWPLLLALDAIQPGCVNWGDAFRPPFKEKLRKILSVQNCNLVIEVCTRQLAMPPLVNIGGLDLALGQRRATLSLVFQMMRHHMGMLLGLVTPHPPPSPTPSTPLPPLSAPSPSTPLPSERPTDADPALPHSMSYPPSATPSSSGGQQHHHPHHPHHQQHHKAMSAVSPTTSLTRPPGLSPGPGASPLSFSHASQQQHPTPPHHHHHQQQQHQRRAYVEVEKAVLTWANTKLSAATATATAAGSDSTVGSHGGQGNGAGGGGGFIPLASFSDPRLGEGRLLLQLLASICPRTVNTKYVLPGRNPEERGSNARYLLSCARKVGCVIFLGWEDVISARPNLMLLLMASFMALDRKRTAAAGAGVGVVEAAGAGAVVGGG